MERVKEQLGNHLQIYTDGSVLETGEVECALVIPNLKITMRYELPAGISIFTAELYAIYMACTIETGLTKTVSQYKQLCKLRIKLHSVAERPHLSH